MEKIQMVNLYGQYLKIKEPIDAAIRQVIDTTAFINGPQVKTFATHLAAYVGCKHAITCGNGTDALQIALMALGLQPGDEVILPAFTYVATAEVVSLLGLVPVMVDVDYDTFNLSADRLEKALTPRSKAIVPVHLFGQACDMAPILEFAACHELYVVEDNAQALGSVYTFPDGTRCHTGTLGHIGCTSFFPSKNLGCYGDGGALLTDDDALAERIRMIANHGQKVKYYHQVIGCNSRLDTLQAALLDVKLPYLDSYCEARRVAAAYYNEGLKGVDGLVLPRERTYSTHVYHQYTLKVKEGKRDALKAYLAENGIPSMIYYPLPLQKQEAFQAVAVAAGSLDTASELAASVLSLPMHTELTTAIQDRVIEAVRRFFAGC